MLHNTTREALLQTGNGYVALVVDAAYFMGWRPYHVFTSAEILDFLRPLGISTKAVMVALHHPAFLQVGRRNRRFTLPAVSSLRKAAGGDSAQSASDELGEEAFSSLRAYRMALHEALIKRRPRGYLRHLLARRLGVCINTTRAYDRALNIVVTPQWRFYPLNDKRLEKLPSVTPQRRKYFLFIKHPTTPFFAPLRLQIALLWMSKGITVQLVQQMGNLYESVRWASRA